MRAVMVKHTTESKGYWFEVPDNLADKIHPGVRVVCDTAIGQQDGTVSSVLLSNGEDDAKEIMIAAGAKFPLRKIVAVGCLVSIDTIKIPTYMTRSVPSEEKIVKRFREYYRTGQFDTRVTVDDSGMLLDGYTAYKVAKMLHLTHLLAVTKG